MGLSVFFSSRLSPSLKKDLQAEQFQILKTQIPLLYAVLTVNTCILASSIHGLVPASLSLAAPAVFLSLIVLRVTVWLIRGKVSPDAAQVSRYLTGTTIVASVVAAGLGLWSIILLNSGVGTRPFVAMFIALGSVACAFCLASLPRAAFATILFATTPVIVALLIAGDHEQFTTGLNLLLIFGLILRLVSHHYHHLVDQVILHSKVRVLAYTDHLTGLPNRALFAERLQSSLKEAGAAGAHVGLIILDVDHFKTVNDSMGHAAGDALLKEIGARLRRGAPAGATVARLGGDEFAIILPGLSAAEANLETVRAALKDLEMPIPFDEQILDAHVSAGAAMWPTDSADADDLLKSADLALYAAKAVGGGAIRGFRTAMRENVRRKTTMLSEARGALNDDRIVPFYQPKVRLATGEVVGFEALLRWHHPLNGLQYPRSIGAALEDKELAAHLTDRMMDSVFADMRGWLQSGVPFGKIAINGAAADFFRGELAERVLERLDRFGIPPGRLELEVTESVFFGRRAESVERTLNALNRAGVTIALDDFGTGYASLTHLKQFPVDVLKIDRSFVSKLTDNDGEEDAVIVGAVLNLAHNLGIVTVAEGIETIAQRNYLRRKGCDLGQGYLFSRAVAASRVPGLVSRRFLIDAGGEVLQAKA
ncbi:MAG: EAL domain-containing protein [Pseudomonadota bacterium]